MSGQSLSGHCLCGAITFAATPTAKDMTACHCGMCRRQTAGPLMTVDCDPAIKINGEANLAIYQSSDYGERAFCKLCGTTLFWRMRDGSLLEVSAQAFDDPGQFPFVQEIYIDHKPANYDFAGGRRRLTEAEFLAAASVNQQS